LELVEEEMGFLETKTEFVMEAAEYLD